MTGQLAAFSVVAVPFPFTDRAQTKRRPALVLSSSERFNNLIGHSVMAMITSAKNSPWPLDVEIRDLRQAGLPSPSVIRFKLFTIDHRLVVSRLGRLSERDIRSFARSLEALIAAQDRQK